LPDGVSTVRQRTADRPLRQRILALAVAYAITLSGFVASDGLARATAAAAGVSGGVICHTIMEADQAPTPDQANHCADNCCVGCIMLVTALPPPPANPANALQSSVQRLIPPGSVAFAIRPETTSHQSRAPPSAA
jgi:hypothetical protein